MIDELRAVYSENKPHFTRLIDRAIMFSFGFMTGALFMGLVLIVEKVTR